MSIEQIFNGLGSLAQLCHNQSITAKTKYARDLWNDMDSVATEAITLLRTHPEAQPNEPLTLEELREMEGWPVWTVTKGISDPGRWELVIDAECEDRLEMAERADGFYEIDTDSYGKTWLAYRRPPKEEAG